MAKHNIVGVHKHNFCYTVDLEAEGSKAKTSLQWTLDFGARMGAEKGDVWDDVEETIIKKGKAGQTGGVVL